MWGLKGIEDQVNVFPIIKLHWVLPTYLKPFIHSFSPALVQYYCNNQIWGLLLMTFFLFHLLQDLLLSPHQLWMYNIHWWPKVCIHNNMYLVQWKQHLNLYNKDFIFWQSVWVYVSNAVHHNRHQRYSCYGARVIGLSIECTDGYLLHINPSFFFIKLTSCSSGSVWDSCPYGQKNT